MFYIPIDQKYKSLCRESTDSMKDELES